MNEETKTEKTDDEIVEERAQEQFKRIMEHKKESELTERIKTRIHELAQAAGLKAQTEQDILENMTLTMVDKMRHKYLEERAERAAESAFAKWKNENHGKLRSM